MIEGLWNDESIDHNISQLIRMIESMEELPDDILASMPEELIEQLEIMVASGILPSELERRIEDILDRI